jgi:hypothetical protein
VSRHHRIATPRAIALALAIVALPALARAQAPATPASNVLDARGATHLRDRYLADIDTVHVKIMALANAIPEDKYGWRPAPGVRSVSEALMHVVGEWYFFTPMSVGGKPPADFGPPRESLQKLETITTKADVIAQLEKSWAHCKAQLTSVDASQLTGQYKPWNVTLADAAFAMSGDLHEHLGQLIAYARATGVKPPWSK